MLSMLRIAVALLFLLHGTQKLFGIPAGTGPRVPLDIWSERGVAGILEAVGGCALLLGAGTRLVAFVLSGEMAVAYFQFHYPRAFFPMYNGGEPAALFSIVFLYLAGAGGGRWSVDACVHPASEGKVRHDGQLLGRAPRSAPPP